MMNWIREQNYAGTLRVITFFATSVHEEYVAVWMATIGGKIGELCAVAVVFYSDCVDGTD